MKNSLLLLLLFLTFVHSVTCECDNGCNDDEKGLKAIINLIILAIMAIIVPYYCFHGETSDNGINNINVSSFNNNSNDPLPAYEEPPTYEEAIAIKVTP